MLDVNGTIKAETIKAKEIVIGNNVSDPEFIKSSSEFKFMSEIQKSTLQWLDSMFTESKNFTSKTHHSPSMGHFDRHDAETIFLITTGIVAYIGKIEFPG